MAAKSDPQRRPVLYDLKNGRFLADPAIGSKYYPIPSGLVDGDATIDLINTATSSVIAAARVVAGTTTQAGVLQLEDSVLSTSTSKAATPNAVKFAYDLAGAANSAASAAASAASAASGAASAAQSTADAALPKSGGAMTGAITFALGQAYPQIPQNPQTSAYTLTANDAGKHISITTGGVTIPQNIFNTGDAISVYNNSSSGQTISQAGGVTLRLAGSSATGNRTLGQHGLCTILCVASNTFVVSGAGLS